MWASFQSLELLELLELLSLPLLSLLLLSDGGEGDASQWPVAPAPPRSPPPPVSNARGAGVIGSASNGVVDGPGAMNVSGTPTTSVSGVRGMGGVRDGTWR